MNDEGFKWSEELLNDLEKRIDAEYAQASKEMTEKVQEHFSKFKVKDEKKRKDYESGKITKAEYTEWRRNQMLIGKRYIALRDTLAQDLTNVDQIAMKYASDAMIDVYALNMNYETYCIEHDLRLDTSFTLYNHDAVERLIKENPDLLPRPKVDIPKDLRWNRAHIQSAITQGILQGESIPKIAKRLQNVTGMDKRAAIRNARTAITSAQNGGRLDSMKRAQQRGIGIKKGWMATLDARTRDSHAVMDGEVVELDKPFSNGLMRPADPHGEPSQVYNCRCRLTHEYDKYRTDWSNPINRNTEKLGDMTYQEWKDKHKTKIVAKSAQKVVIQNNLVMPKRPRKADYDDIDKYYQAREEYRKNRAIYDEQREKLIDEMMGGNKQYKTVEDLKEWARLNNVILTDGIDKEVDERLYNDVLGALDEMFTKYPEVKERFNEYGFRLAFTDTSEYYAEANGGLRLGGIFKDARVAYGAEIDSQAEGFTVRGDGTLRAMIRHEYGHNTDNYIRQKFSTLDSTYEWKISGKTERRQEALRQYEKELIEITTKYGSEYSRTNTLEAFAEGFSEYTSNPNSEYGKAFGTFFERWYNANPIE